jgi:Icc-related predicted phosphoesterase
VDKKKAKRFVDNSIKRGRAVLQKLNSYNVPVYVIPGNWDFAIKDREWKYVNRNLYHEYIIKGLKNVKDIHRKIIRVDDYNIIGYGLVNGPELLKYRYYKNIPKDRYKINVQNYKKLLKKYDKLFKKAKLPVILLAHNVPYNTPLDKIVNKSSPMNGKHYGSNLAREMILRHKPLLCIGAHMHEHYGTCKLGRTLVLNAGFGGEKNTLIELQDGKIKDIKFYGKRK